VIGYHESTAHSNHCDTFPPPHSHFQQFYLCGGTTAHFFTFQYWLLSLFNGGCLEKIVKPTKVSYWWQNYLRVFAQFLQSTNRFSLSVYHVFKTTILHQDRACLFSPFLISVMQKKNFRFKKIFFLAQNSKKQGPSCHSSFVKMS